MIKGPPDAAWPLCSRSSGDRGSWGRGEELEAVVVLLCTRSANAGAAELQLLQNQLRLEVNLLRLLCALRGRPASAGEMITGLQTDSKDCC